MGFPLEQLYLKLCAEQYLNFKIPRDKRSAFTRLRCGVLSLEIETGRYSRTPLDQRICKLCNIEVETEIHFLTKCPIYCNQRMKLFDIANEFYNNFNEMGSEQKICILLSSKKLQSTVINYVHEMFLTRKLAIVK